MKVCVEARRPLSVFWFSALLLLSALGTSSAAVQADTAAAAGTAVTAGCVDNGADTTAGLTFIQICAAGRPTRAVVGPAIQVLDSHSSLNINTLLSALVAASAAQASSQHAHAAANDVKQSYPESSAAVMSMTAANVRISNGSLVSLNATARAVSPARLAKTASLIISKVRLHPKTTVPDKGPSIGGRIGLFTAGIFNGVNDSRNHHFQGAVASLDSCSSCLGRSI